MIRAYISSQNVLVKVGVFTFAIFGSTVVIFYAGAFTVLLLSGKNSLRQRDKQ